MAKHREGNCRLIKSLALLIGLLSLACGGVLELGLEGPAPTRPPPVTATAIVPTVATTEILPTASPPATPTPAEASQPEENISGLALALAKHFNIRPEEVRFGLVEQTQTHAKGSLSGGYFLAAREADGWLIVYEGQAAPDCGQIAPYDFPLRMVPECRDETNTLVRRTGPEAEPAGDDTKAIEAALLEKTGIPAEKLQFAVAQNTGTHARGTLKHKDDVGGGYFIAAKDDGRWVIVYDGQATPGCGEIAPYGFPIDMVPECLDGTGNLVVRATGGTGPTNKEAQAGITLVGRVMDVSLSAQIIMLQEPVDGFSVVALTEDSELFSPEGDVITLQNIGPGVRLEAYGVPGDSNALLASRVRLLP